MTNGQLSASVSIGMTRQVRQYEPVNVHISVQGITAETPMEEVEELCRTTVAEAAKVIGKQLVREVNAKLEDLRDRDPLAA
jgi:hypothetical protein